MNSHCSKIPLKTSELQVGNIDIDENNFSPTNIPPVDIKVKEELKTKISTSLKGGSHHKIKKKK